MSARREIFTDAWKYFHAFKWLCFSGAPPRDRPRDRAKDDPADHALRDHAIHDIHESGHFASLFLLFGPFFSSLSRPNGGSGRKEIFTVAWEYFDAFKWLCLADLLPAIDLEIERKMITLRSRHPRYISFDGLLRLVGHFPVLCPSSLKLTFSGNVFASWKF